MMKKLMPAWLFISAMTISSAWAVENEVKALTVPEYVYSTGGFATVRGGPTCLNN